MSLAKTIVSRPTTMLIIFILLVFMGLFAWTNLPIDLMPEINPPYLFVMTTYSGAGPEEVERSVTRLLESSLSNASGLDKLTSTSSKGYSFIQMEFVFGTDLADATNSVRDSLERIRRALPTEADTPMIIRYSPSSIPIMGFAVTGNRTPEELREIAENTVAPRMEQVDGVAQAAVAGGREKIIRVEIPQTRLEAYNLTVTSLLQPLAAQNAQVSAGTITDEGLSYILTTMGEYTSIDEIKDTVVAYKGGGYVNGQASLPKTVRIGDLADVFWGYRAEESLVYVNGVPTVQITVQKQSGKNSVQVANALRTRVEEIAGEVPADIKITETYNTTDQVESLLGQVGNTAISGALLAVIVIFIFLRSWKPTIIIGISIPISVIVTVMFMYFAGLTLNMMTLAGLVLGIGMLVDNSIVILENIYHYREKGAKIRTAAMLGTQEMMIAIIASTLTTISVFAPLVMFQGLLEMAGELFAGLAFTVVISLATSLFTALFLVPVLAGHYFPLVTRKQKALTGPLAKFDALIAGFFTWLEGKYMSVVRKVLAHKKKVIVFLAVLFLGSLALIPVIGWIFYPSMSSDSVSLSVTLPVGASLSETEGTLKQLEAIAQNEVKGYERIIINAGGGSSFNSGSSSNSGTIAIYLPDYDKRIDDAETIKNKLRNHFNEFPGVSLSLSGGSGMGGGTAIDITVRCEDIVKGKAVANQIADVIRAQIEEATEPSVSLNDGLPQIELRIDRERLYALGLNTYTVGNEIKAAVDGITATRYKSSGIDYDVVLILAEADRDSMPDLEQVFVTSPVSGGRVALSNFVYYEKGSGPISVTRENQSRVIHVTAGVKSAKTPLNVLDAKVRKAISSSVPLENDVILEYGGGNADMQKIFMRFCMILVVAVCLVFGIMASLFESFRDPFIVILTIPLSVIGIVAIYLLTGDIFNVLTAVGLLVLAGVIVNNGIVLVDYTNLLRKRGLSVNEACVQAAGNRLRPILMTTMTTVLGLAPMAFFPGEGSEMVGPIGKTVLGGLSFGTLMTLVLMPAIYAIINKNDDERRARSEARRERIASGGKKAAKSKPQV